jgi:surface protein
VTNMYAMFKDCSSLTSLYVSNWDTSNVTDMTDMFKGCDGLPDLARSDPRGYVTSLVRQERQE